MFLFVTLLGSLRIKFAFSEFGGDDGGHSHLFYYILLIVGKLVNHYIFLKERDKIVTKLPVEAF